MARRNACRGLLAVVLLAGAACGPDGSGAPPVTSHAEGTILCRPSARSAATGKARFTPPARREGEVVVLPLVFPDGTTAELSGAERERGIAIYSRRSEAHGAGQWRGADVVAPAAHRLYRARASQHFVLQANDQRILVHVSRGPGTGDLGTEA
jgi:hypothetical protein